MKAATYARVSTKRQAEEGVSLQAQTKRAVAYAASQGWEVTHSFEEQGVSGRRTDRPELDKLRQLVSNGDVSRVIVFKMSRLGRSARDVLNRIYEFQSRGAEVIFIEEGLDTSKASHRLIITVLAGVAEMEAENMAEQVMPSMEETASERKFMGGSLPWGTVRDDDGYLTEHPEQADAIRMMVKKTLEGMRPTDLADLLNAQGFKPSRARRFRAKDVRFLLRQRRLTGEYFWKDFPIQHPQIIDADTWARLQQELGIISGSTARDVWPLSGRVFCSCGGYLIGGGTLQGVRRYRCNRHLNHKREMCTCDHGFNPGRPIWWNADNIEAGVWQQVVLLLNNRKLLEDAVNRYLGLDGGEPDLKALQKAEQNAKRMEDIASRAAMTYLEADDDHERALLEKLMKESMEISKAAREEHLRMEKAHLDAHHARIEATRWLKVADNLSISFGDYPARELMKQIFIDLDLRARIRTTAGMPHPDVPFWRTGRATWRMEIGSWVVLDNLVMTDHGRAGRT